LARIRPISVFVANADVGLNDSSVDEDYNIAYGNGTNFSSGPGAHDLVTDPQLKYVTRVEANTPGKGTASDGGDRGANVLYQYVGGALTTAALWPWPYEDRIKADMCGSSFLASVGRTGSNAAQWCASGKTLTRYIWEAAGNPIPPEIYGDGSPAPAPPTNVRIR
jgi:hypothetical protein